MTFTEHLKTGDAILVQSSNSFTAGRAPSLFTAEKNAFIVINAEQNEITIYDAEHVEKHLQTMQALGFSVQTFKNRAAAQVCYTAACSTYKYAWY